MIARCSVCDCAVHASESDDLDRCVDCAINVYPASVQTQARAIVTANDPDGARVESWDFRFEVLGACAQIADAEIYDSAVRS